MNKIILIGNIGITPEIRTLDRGTKIVNFSLATTERWKNKSGEDEEQTEWHRIEGWNNIATAIENNAKKGDRLFIEGKVITNKWTDNNGAEKSSTKVRIARVEFLGYRREQMQKNEPQITSKENPKVKKEKVEKPKVVFEEQTIGDDLPF